MKPTVQSAETSI